MPAFRSVLRVTLSMALLALLALVIVPYFLQTNTIREMMGGDSLDIRASYIDKADGKFAGSMPTIHVKSVDCSALVNGDRDEMVRAEKYQKKEPGSRMLSDRELASLSQNCSQFREQRQYINKPISAEEEAFPLAFSILLYKDAGMAERLLRAIYRPQNVYCLHVDANSPDDVHDAIGNLTECFPNVFMAHRLVDVVWARYPVLEAELICMEALWKYRSWRYFINLTGQEFPLKTNLEIVKILMVHDGTNIVDGTHFNWLRGETQDRFRYSVGDHGRKEPFPHNITFYKGNTHVAVTRQFVGFVLNDPVAKQLQEWCKDLLVPDEFFFNTLQFNPQLGVPGAINGGDGLLIPWIRHKMWNCREDPCHGIYNRGICIVGVGDLPLLAKSRSLFVNKLHADYQPLTYDCLEELQFNRTKADAMGHSRRLNLIFYKQLHVHPLSGDV